MKTTESFIISNDSVILFGETAITGKLIDEISDTMKSVCSAKFHNQMVERKIFSSQYYS